MGYLAADGESADRTRAGFSGRIDGRRPTCDTRALICIGRLLAPLAKHARLAEVLILIGIGMAAFGTRLFSVLRYESVIHEFDPWFNFRATKYLVEHGWYAFLNWFDERAWYPLGRVVGVTVYPGIMITSAVLHHAANTLLALDIDIREICVFLAPIFSALTATATYLLTRELAGSGGGLLAAALIAICPGYISRSVAGSYDNEGIAIFLMMATFYCWIRAVKRGSAGWATATALSYWYMVSSWGGYVFLINLIPLHAFALLVMGRYSDRLYTAYCTFYVLGTLASMTIPFVGLTPTRSNEHMAALGTFCLLQLMALADRVRALVNDERHFKILTRVVIMALSAALLAGLVALTVTGHVAPWTGRFYSLWDTSYARKHIPIIASVSEHQPTTWASFFLDLHLLLFLAPVGLWSCFEERRDEHIFAIMYALTASYFAGVMVRLILTLTPIMCVLGAMALTRLFSTLLSSSTEGSSGDDAQSSKAVGHSPPPKSATSLPWDSRLVALATFMALLGYYVWHCTWVASSAYSSPSIMLSQTDYRTGRARIVDDFREAYYWLRRNTPDSAKVLAWWDYGYQLAGMADRTTIVDNNTWNNTHIATVGKAMALSEEDAYPVLRQLDTDYVLVLSGAMSGFGGDDINKFLWMARIAEGVFPDEVREADYLSESGEYRLDGGAPKALRQSILYKMCYYGLGDTVLPSGRGDGEDVPMDRARQMPLPGVDPKLSVLDEAYTTESRIVRIFKVRSPDPLGRSLFAKQH